MRKRTHVLSVTADDLGIDTFRAGGKGGQNQNKVNSGVRVTHEASGAVGESREERDQLKNKKTAFKRMTETTEFKSWVDLQIEIDRGNIKYEEMNSEGVFKEKKIDSIRN